MPATARNAKCKRQPTPATVGTRGRSQGGAPERATASADLVHAKRARRRPRMHSAAGFVAVALALLAGPADSTPICQWVDASGRHQIADVVPERDKPLATCTDSRQYELSPAQRRVAAQGAVERRARALRDTATPPSEPVTGSPGAVGKATRRMAKRPAEVVTDATACPTWWRLYDESGECFAPFRTARGGTKAEAFDVCNEVPSPEPKCGPRRN